MPGDPFAHLQHGVIQVGIADVDLLYEVSHFPDTAQRVSVQLFYGLFHSFWRHFVPREEPHHQPGVGVVIKGLIASQIAMAAVGAFPHKERAVLDPGFQVRVLAHVDALAELNLRGLVAVATVCERHR